MKRILAAGALALLAAACNPPSTPGPSSGADDPPPDSGDAGDDGDLLVDELGRVFSYLPVGDLIMGSAPPAIVVDTTIYDDLIAFPTEGPVYINSQVYGHGGSKAGLNGKSGDQCHPENYDYPWQDNFCEKRGRNQYFCQQGGHTGVDIRPATCVKGTHWVVAPEAGEIYDIGTYGVRLMADDGTWYQFLHMDPASLAVAAGQEVARGQRIGKISNVFFDAEGNPVPTTIHVHLDMKESYAPETGDAPFIDRVNPYMTLVAAYERKLAGE